MKIKVCAEVEYIVDVDIESFDEITFENMSEDDSDDLIFDAYVNQKPFIDFKRTTSVNELNKANPIFRYIN